MQLAEIMKSLETMTKDERDALPRDVDGKIVIEEYVAGDGTRMSVVWNEVEGAAIVLRHADSRHKH